MKKFKTYGKVKVKQDMKSDDWDKIKEETSLKDKNVLMHNWVSTPRSYVCDKNTAPSSTDDVVDIMAKLKITSQSTPLLSTPCDTSYTLKCRRSFNFFTSKNNSFRKTTVSAHSTMVLESSSSFNSTSALSTSLLLNKDLSSPKSPRNKLLDLCNQKTISVLKDYADRCSFAKKVGEGSYGEVFEKVIENGQSLAVKIVPFGSDTLVNGYPQMKEEDIVPEMVISKRLSCASGYENDEENFANGFIQLHRLTICKGKYPEKLVKIWEEWNKEVNSENDHPEIFDEDQLYIVFESNFGGVDLEKLSLKTYKEAFSIINQIVTALASAESTYEFEHRDLHWGNILIHKGKHDKINMLVDEIPYTINSCGLKVSIIDFTMARLLADDCVVFTDLSDEKLLFEGKGDIQFDVYRNMRKHNNNEWEKFSPYSNVLWIRYVTEKLISKLSRSTTTLKKFLARVLDYASARDILYNDELFSFPGNF